MFPIPSLVIATLGLIGTVALVKLIAKERKRVNIEVDRARQRTRAGTEHRQSLRRDPDTGIYRP